jgi:hypothetical protein
MQGPKLLNTKSRSDAQGRSALDDGMDRVCEKLDLENVAPGKVAIKSGLSKSVRRRFIPLKGEKPKTLGADAASSSSHWPWIKKHANPKSKP